MRTDDGCIIQECLNGKPEAFGLLVDKYKAGIYAFVYVRLGNFQDTQDVVQQVFEEAYRSLSSLRRWESFVFWLYRIARNLCMDLVQAQSKRPDREFIEDQHLSVLETSSLNSYHENKVNESIQEALDSLPEIYREVLVLYYFGGMTIKDIARAIGVSPVAIGKRLSRARSKLKGEMIAMMDTAFEEHKLDASFTFQIVEMVKNTRIQPLPRPANLPWIFSLAAGIILVILSLGSYINIPIQVDALIRSPNLKEISVMKESEIPVNVLRISQKPFMSGSIGSSNNGTQAVFSKENAVLLAPGIQGGKFPEKPSVQLGKGMVRRIAYSPDGKIFVLTGSRGIRLYDADNLNEIATLSGDPYYGIAFSPDGKLLASGNLDYNIILWDVNEQKQIGTLKGHTNITFSMTFSPDGKILASGSYDKTIRLWDIRGQKQIGSLQGHTDLLSSIAFSPDGKILASGSYDKTICLWDIQTQKQIGLLQGHTDAVFSVAFSIDGKILASGGYDKTVRLWDVQGQKQTGLLQKNSSVNSVAFSPDGKILASANDETVDFWDVQEQKQVGSLAGYKDWYSTILSPDGKTIASICATSKDSSYMISFWDVQEQRQTGLLDGFLGSIFSLTFSPDGKSLASGSWDKIIRLWDIQGQKQTGLLEGYLPSWTGTVGAIFTSNGKTMASIVGKEIYLFNVHEQKQIGTLKGHSGYISSIAFTPDGKILASAGNQDQTVRLWDVANQKEIGVLRNNSWTHCLAISPGGETLAVSVGGERLVRLWDIKTQKEVGVLRDTCAAYSVAISPDGKTVAAGNQCGEIILWDMESQNKTGVLRGGPISAIHPTFSPDGKWIVSVGCYNSNGNIDNITRVWDVQKQEQIATVEGHTENVWYVAFSPGGKWMASGGVDGVILLWEVNLTVPGHAVETTGKLPGTWGEVKKTTLLQNFPNPFNPETWIPFYISESERVEIDIYDSTGKLVRNLDLGQRSSGSYISKEKAAYWNGKNNMEEPVSGGVYFYTFRAGDFSATKKMVVVR